MSLCYRYFSGADVYNADAYQFTKYNSLQSQRKAREKIITITIYEGGAHDEARDLEFRLIALSKHHCIHILWENVIYVNYNHQVEYLTVVTIYSIASTSASWLFINGTRFSYSLPVIIH